MSDALKAAAARLTSFATAIEKNDHAAMPAEYRMLDSGDDGADVVLADLRAVIAAAEPGFTPTHRHVASGFLYQVIDDDALEATNGYTEGRRLVVYRNEAGRHFSRMYVEFMDGRFEVL